MRHLLSRSASRPGPLPTTAAPGRTTPRRPTLAVLLALTLGGCRGEASQGPVMSLDRWEMGPEQVRIGSVHDPEHAFAAVRALAIDPSGRIYTAHFQELQVRLWTPDGASAGVVGRQGEGPGEFTAIWGLGFFGDSLWVYGSNRTSFFGPDGTFLGSLAPPVELGDRESGYPLPARPELPLRDGGFYGSSPAFSQAVAEGDITWTPHVRMSAEGAVTDTLYRQQWRPESQLALLRPDGAGGTFGQQPFPDGPIVAPDVARGRLLVAERPAWAGSGPATWSVTAISMRGDTLWRHEQAYQPVPLPAERLDSAATTRAEGLHAFMTRFEEGLTVAALKSRVDEALYRPAWYPPVTALIGGRDGSVWVGLAPTADEPSGDGWLVLDERGRPTAHARTPAGLRVLAADLSHVWGVVTDELDVSYIVRRAVVRGEPSVDAG